MSAASECEYGCSNGLLYDPRIEGSVVDCPGCKVSRDNAGEEPADAAVTVRDSAAASPEPTAAQDQEPMTVEALVAQARVAQSELAWLGGFLETGVPDRPDLPERTDRAYRLIELLIEEVTP